MKKMMVFLFVFCCTQINAQSVQNLSQDSCCSCKIYTYRDSEFIFAHPEKVRAFRYFSSDDYQPVDHWNAKSPIIRRFFSNIEMFRNLEWLRLSDVVLDSLPNNFNKLTKLKCLYFQNAKVIKNFEVVAHLPSLQYLTLQTCELNLDTVFNSKNGFINLIDLTVSNGNETNTFVPQQIFSLTNLHSLAISGFQDDTISKEIANLKKLEKLRIGLNIQEVPPYFVQLKNINLLDLRGTMVKNIPEYLFQIKTLKLYLLGGCDAQMGITDCTYIKHLTSIKPRGWKIIFVPN